MRRRAGLATAWVVMVGAVWGAEPAAADHHPANCTSNRLDLTISRDRAIVRPGETVNYAVRVANDGAGACDVSGVTITVTLPAADGTPTGATVTLATNAAYPAGTAEFQLGVVPYTVAVNPGVTDAVVEAKASDGVLHDATNDHRFEIFKRLG